MPETCRHCGEDLDGRSRLRLVHEDWLAETASGPPGYMDVTVGVFCGEKCLRADMSTEVEE